MPRNRTTKQLAMCAAITNLVIAQETFASLVEIVILAMLLSGVSQCVMMAGESRMQLFSASR